MINENVIGDEPGNRSVQYVGYELPDKNSDDESK